MRKLIAQYNVRTLMESLIVNQHTSLAFASLAGNKYIHVYLSLLQNVSKRTLPTWSQYYHWKAV